MIPRDRGHIVNISSQAGKYGAPGGATYSATKHAVVGLTEAVRGELRLMGAQRRPQLRDAVRGQDRTRRRARVTRRGMKHLEPREVADAIVEALQLRDRGSVGAEVRRAAAACWPPCSRARSPEGFARALKADAVLAGADFGSRRNYELRASRSEPGLEAARSSPRSRAPSPRLHRRRELEAARSGRARARRAAAERARQPAMQPLGDQLADQRALVLLQEVARVLDRARGARGRSPSAKRSPVPAG